MTNARSALLFLLVTIPLTITFSVTSGSGGLAILLFPFTAIIGILFAFLLAPVFLLIHRKVAGNYMQYEIGHAQSLSQGRGALSGLFPALMATNFTLALIFNPFVMSLDFLQSYYAEWNGIIFIFIILCAIMQIPAFALFSSAWTILDAGIVSYSQEIYLEGMRPEIRSVGSWFLGFLKGYAGIGVIVSLYQFTMEFLAVYGSSVHYSAVVVLVLLPFLVAIWVIPAIIVMNVTAKARVGFIHNIARSLGATTAGK